MEPKHAATGLSHGHGEPPEHAERAVKRALAKADLARANAVLLFLTPHYAQSPDAALRAAAREAGALAIMGCTAAGLLTEENWLLDSPGAAAMVFGGRFRFLMPGGYAGIE